MSNELICYFNGNYLPADEIRVSPFDRGFMFADGVYEVVRIYKGRIFLMDQHLMRLERNLAEINIPFRNTIINDIIFELLRKNLLVGKDAVAYIQITRGNQFPRSRIFNPNTLNPSLFISVNELPLNRNSDVTSVLLFEDIRWGRCDIKTILLLPSVLASQEAASKGFGEAAWHQDGIISEGSQTNIFFVKEDEVFTPPLNKRVLPGVTRLAVINICKKLGIPVLEENIKVSGLNSFKECFITGTTTEVKPVTRIDNHIVGDGKAGKITKVIQNSFYSETNDPKNLIFY